MTKNKIIPYNKNLRVLARQLRNNSTLSEVLFWNNIKGKSYGYEFHRQVPINDFIVDFFSHELNLSIKLIFSLAFLFHTWNGAVYDLQHLQHQVYLLPYDNEHQGDLLPCRHVPTRWSALANYGLHPGCKR